MSSCGKSTVVLRFRDDFEAKSEPFSVLSPLTLETSDEFESDNARHGLQCIKNYIKSKTKRKSYNVSPMKSSGLTIVPPVINPLVKKSQGQKNKRDYKNNKDGNEGGNWQDSKFEVFLLTSAFWIGLMIMTFFELNGFLKELEFIAGYPCFSCFYCLVWILVTYYRIK